MAQKWLLRDAMIVGVTLLAAFSATSCGSGLGVECSGGSPVDGTCQSTQPTVHWTAERASVAADHFSYAPMVPGRLSQASCRISARFGGHEAKAICSANFTAPHKPSQRIRITLQLAGTGGVMGVRCPRQMANNPFCRWNKAHP
jgi:hypothetical protein